MSSNRLLDLVDNRDFRTLFIEELGWDNPDHPNVRHEVDGATYTLTNVASFKGLRIWHCPQLPSRPVQRQIDVLVGRDTLERLVIFTSEHKQEWRWPRRSQLGAANAKLLAHPYIPGDPNYRTLAQRLEAIELDFDEDISLVTLLDRMRLEFDQEAETASAQAARLMGGLYTELEKSGVDEHNSTLLLARLLFLLFGDDADMWRPASLFETYLREHTAVKTIHTDLAGLFDTLNTEERCRKLPADSPYQRFRYINGGLFDDPQSLPPLTSTFHELLLEACTFDWSIISPAIFGGMFQTVKSKESRREAGEHYTSEKNILRTIGPLFLDDYRTRLDQAKGSKRELTKLHNELGGLRYLDPACGCGNFLIVAYREMRALELELLKLRRDLDLVDPALGPAQRAQLSLDVSSELKVTLDQFHGFEISEWPARIAETAMLLVDHLANQQMAEEFGVAPDRLPIKISAKISCTNALQIDWRGVVSETAGRTYSFGNPPFLGDHTRTKEQLADLRAAWGGNKTLGRLDYVTGWHAKTLDLLRQRAGEFAYVTTNSITQGDQVARLFAPIFEEGWRIKFGHRTFAWDSEAPGKAAVHCVIVGFTKDRGAPQRLWDYETPNSPQIELTIKTGINAYLVDGPNVLVGTRRRPLSPGLPELNYGSKPSDGGNLIITEQQIDSARRDPAMSKYIRPYIGTDQLLNGRKRWCLWLVDLDPADLSRSAELRRRIDAVREARGKSDAKTTREYPHDHLFRQIGFSSDSTFIALPEVSSENRRYLPVGFLGPECITSNKIYAAEDDGGLLFAIASSTMFITWMKTVGGRMESRLSLSSTITWNNFPLPDLSSRSREAIVKAGRGIRAAREKYPERSMAEHYNTVSMDPTLIAAHKALDELIDEAFGATGRITGLEHRQEFLFAHYGAMTSTSQSSAQGGSLRSSSHLANLPQSP